MLAKIISRFGLSGGQGALDGTTVVDRQVWCRIRAAAPRQPRGLPTGAVEENSLNLIKIVDHRPDLQFRAFSQVKAVLTATGPRALGCLPSTTGTFDLHRGDDSGDTGWPVGAMRAPASVELVPGPVGPRRVMSDKGERGATTRDRPGCPVDNGTEAAAGRHRVGPKGTRAGSVSGPRRTVPPGWRW